MIDDAALVAAILAAGYTSDQIGQIADALGASYAAVAQPGATRDEEARGLVEFARRHDLAGELAALILDTAAEKKAVQNYLFGTDRGSHMESNRPDLDRLFQHSDCGGSSFESSVFIRRKEEKVVCTAAGAVLCAVCDCCHGVADRCSAFDRK